MYIDIAINDMAQSRLHAVIWTGEFFLTNVFLLIYASLDLKDSFLPNFSYTNPMVWTSPLKTQRKLWFNATVLKLSSFTFLKLGVYPGEKCHIL